MEEEGIGKNTLRFQLKNLAGLWGRRKFVLEIVFGLLELGAEDVHCLKENIARGRFDLTLHTEEECLKVMGMYEENKEMLPASVFSLEPLFLKDWRTVFVTIPCPFFPVEDITTSLRRNLELKSEFPVKVMDSEGLWNGVYKYTARLFIRDGKMIHVRPDRMIGASYAQAARDGEKKKEKAKGKTEKGKKPEDKETKKDKGESVGGGVPSEGGGMAGNSGSEKTKERGGELNREAEKKKECSTKNSQQRSSEGSSYSVEDSMEGVEGIQRKRKVDEEGATASTSWAKSVEEEEEKRKKKGESKATNSGVEEGMSMEKKEDIIMNRFCATEFAELLAWKERLRKGRFSEREWRSYEGERQRILLCATWKPEESLRDIEVVLDEVLRDHAPVDVEECAEAGDTLRGTLPTASPVAISREAPADKSESRTAGHPVAGTSATGETNKKLATHVGTQPEKMTIEESSQGTEIPDTPVEGRVQWGDTEGDKEMDWKKAEGKKTAKRKITNERLDKDNKVQVIETSNKFGALENEETGDEGVQSSELSLTGESPLAPPVTPSEDGSDGSMESQPEYLSDTMMDNLKTTMMSDCRGDGGAEKNGGEPFLDLEGVVVFSSDELSLVESVTAEEVLGPVSSSSSMIPDSGLEEEGLQSAVLCLSPVSPGPCDSGMVVLEEQNERSYVDTEGRQAGQCTQKAWRSWEEEDERSGKAETELFSGARSPRSQGGGNSSSSSKAPLCRD
ncbi:UNVERIFIED_CONTAM: hypothetical protein FKN15_017950 [Acipenser sinensis]